MLKVTISLPSGTTITFETTDPHMYSEVIASTREYITSDLSPRMSDDSVVSSDRIPPQINGSDQGDRQFLEFCNKHSPVGDMRRVVVAAEGARQFLGLNRVSSQELGTLFDFVQWPRPKNFVQTLRNAGRSNFQWLQRTPGSAGYYSVTDQGRKEIVQESFG